MVMGAVHGVVRVMLMMVMLVVMKAALGAEGLWVGSRGRGGVGERGRGRREEDERAMAHIGPLGAGDIAAAVAAGVSQVAARTLRKTWKLKRRRRAQKMMKRQQRGEEKSRLFLGYMQKRNKS